MLSSTNVLKKGTMAGHGPDQGFCSTCGAEFGDFDEYYDHLGQRGLRRERRLSGISTDELCDAATSTFQERMPQLLYSDIDESEDEEEPDLGSDAGDANSLQVLLCPFYTSVFGPEKKSVGEETPFSHHMRRANQRCRRTKMSRNFLA